MLILKDENEETVSLPCSDESEITTTKKIMSLVKSWFEALKITELCTPRSDLVTYFTTVAKNNKTNHVSHAVSPPPPNYEFCKSIIMDFILNSYDEIPKLMTLLSTTPPLQLLLQQTCFALGSHLSKEPLFYTHLISTAD
jgi:hypothetical protein